MLIPGFTLDLAELQGAFEEVEDLMWQSLNSADDEGPRIGVGGVFQGRLVFLQALAYAPEDTEPGIKLDRTRRRS